MAGTVSGGRTGLGDMLEALRAEDLRLKLEQAGTQ
jgi:hypothetical protein